MPCFINIVIALGKSINFALHLPGSKGFCLNLICAILQRMNANQHIWRIWVDTLHRWGLQNLVASLLDGLGPLTILGAQFVYIGKPLLNGVLPADHLRALSDLLENGDQVALFSTLLREDAPL